jgi:acetyl esterase/lipase
MSHLIERNVVFGQTDKEYLTADVYRPTGGEDLPAVILIHGGGYQAGSKEMYKDWGSYLAEEGFVAMSINYRLTTSSYSTWPGVLDDVRSAVNWLLSKANEWKIEPQRIGFIGDSAGAYLATHYSLVSATNASYKINAVVAVYGSYDNEQAWKYHKTIGNNKVEKMMGATPKEAPEEYKRASPINKIEEAVSNPAFDTSYFIIWGEDDEVALPSQSQNLTIKLQEAGVEVKALAIPGYGHFWFNILPDVEGGTIGDYPNTLIAPQIVEFLKEKLCSPVIGNFSKLQSKKIREMINKKDR